MHGGRSLAAEAGKNHLKARVLDDEPPEALANVSAGECKRCQKCVRFGVSLQSVNAPTREGEKRARTKSSEPCCLHLGERQT